MEFKVDPNPDVYPRFIGKQIIPGFEDLCIAKQRTDSEQENVGWEGVFLNIQRGHEEPAPRPGQLEATAFIQANSPKIKQALSSYIKSAVYPVYKEYLEPYDDHDAQLIKVFESLNASSLHKVISLSEIQVMISQREGFHYTAFHCDFVLDDHGLILFLHKDRVFNFCGYGDFGDQVDLDMLNIGRGENPSLTFEIQDLDGVTQLKGQSTFSQGLPTHTLPRGRYVRIISNGDFQLKTGLILG